MLNRIASALFVSFLFLSGAAYAVDLPKEAEFLQTLSGDENQLVDATRRLMLQQQALMKWDQSLIEEYSGSGEGDLARTQQETLEKRGKLIRTAWEWVLERYPKNAKANNYLGEYLFDYEGDEATGLQYWLTAAQLDENLGAVQNNLGILYFEHGEYPRGLACLERALKLEPENPDYLFNMAQMYLIHFDAIETLKKESREKLYKQAMEMSEKAAQLAPSDYDIVQDYAVNFFAAENFAVKADWKAAAAAWKKVQALARTEDERFFALLNEARSLNNAGDPAAALAPVEAALKLRPDNGAARSLRDKLKAAA